MFGFKKKFDAWEANENAALAKAAYDILMRHNIEIKLGSGTVRILL